MTFEIASKATIILAGAFAAAALLRRRSAAERHMAWTAAFAALLALPAIALIGPSWSVPAAGPLFAIQATASPGEGGGFPLKWIWWTGIMVVAARLLFSHFLMWRWVARLGGGAVIRHEEVSSAMTWGLLTPTILLPQRESRDSVVLHEQAHADRFDGLWRLVAQAACAVYWFHPLVWIAARKASEEAERACDDLVLGQGAVPADYAEALVSEARVSSLRAVAATPFAPVSGLERRVRALLDRGVDRRRVSKQALATAVAAAVVLLAPLAGLRAEDVVHKVGGDVEAPRVQHKVEPKYTEAARDAKVEGTVVLQCVVTKHGKAEKIMVVRGLDPGLDENAVAAVEQWTFAPGKKKGEAVAVAAKIEVNFRLQ